MHQEIHEVLVGKRKACCAGAVTAASSPARCILSGSFNPLHQGHRKMAAYAKAFCGSELDFELSVTNVDKVDLTIDEVVARLKQFDSQRVWVTRSPTFATKASLFPECTFVVGMDTAIRLFDEQYYDSAASLANAIAILAEHGCRFLVFGRLIKDRFVDAASLAIPRDAVQLFDLVPEVSFRVDISSSEIRGKSRKGQT